ncbi:MAG: aspartate aminotransferase family protein [Thermodesulfobacteriota bacterium]|nr:aspartate aminotransferase family protein [Thermodesulfobacteriota bacterium]
MKNNTRSLADTFMFQTYGRLPLTLIRGEGCRVWDEDGKEYLDFVGGLAVCALGHSSSLVTRALEDQSKTLIHVSNLYYTRPQVELARLLVENSFADRVFFCNSGAEANEAAIKLARHYSNDKFGPGRHKIISMDNSFHGRTMATLSATGQNKIRIGYDPLLEGFKFVPFNDLPSLKDAVDDSICAVMLEPIQGEGGVVCPHADYLKGVWDICRERDLLLIFDEVQVGMGRTGRLFAHEHYGVTPHVMTLAKAMGNGLPIGAMLSIEALSGSFGPGSHATTFGGTPLVTAVAKDVLKSLLEDGWIENCKKVGEYFKGRLVELQKKYSFIKEVRGLGLILGIEIDRPGAPIVDACIEKGFLINCTQDKVLRFLPPLIVGNEEIDLLAASLDEIFSVM